MQVQVETRPGVHGEPEPRAFSMGARRLLVHQILDRWLATDHAYFKLQADDGGLYILRFDASTLQWELTLFQAAPPPVPR